MIKNNAKSLWLTVSTSHVKWFGTFVIFSLIPAIVPQAHAVPALSISVPTPLEVDFDKATKAVTPANAKAVIINVALTAGNCSAPMVTALMLGKVKDKNTTSYPIKKECPKAGDFTTTITTSPADIIPDTLGAELIRFCAGGKNGLYSSPMKAVLYGSAYKTIAEAAVKFPMMVNCGVTTTR